MIATLVDLTTALAFLSALIVLLVSRSGRIALRVLLDLLVATSLLRLALAETWTALAMAAAVVTLRQVLWAAVATARPDRTEHRRRPAAETVRP